MRVDGQMEEFSVGTSLLHFGSGRIGALGWKFTDQEKVKAEEGSFPWPWHCS